MIKTIIFLVTILHLSSSAYSQVNSNTKKISPSFAEFGKPLVLEMNEQSHFQDSLIISLIRFSHKQPMLGGPTKAMAILSVAKGSTHQEIVLSTHGIQGKSTSEDGLSDAERYDKLVWSNYEFQLKKFDYDTSIQLIVLKKK